MDCWRGIIVLVLANYVDVSYPFEKPPHIVMVVADDMVCPFLCLCVIKTKGCKCNSWNMGEKYALSGEGRMKFPKKWVRRGNDFLKNQQEKRNEARGHKKISYACLFSVHNTISLSRHEQVCLIRLRFVKYFSHHRQRKWICHAYLKEIYGPGRK